MLRRSAARLGNLVAASLRQQSAASCSAFTQEQASSVAVQQWRQGSVLVRAYATNSHDIFNIHVPGPNNQHDTPFDFTHANYERAAEIIAKYPSNYKASAVIPLLDLAQQQNQGWLNLAAMNKVAEILEMAPIRVFEVATFYTMFNRSPMGKYHVMVCGTTPCMLCGAREVYKALHDHLGIGYGQTTEDGYFTLGEMECMGSCVNAPMIAVADYTKGAEGFSYNYYEDLSPADAVKIVEDLRAGKAPRVGSQYRNKAEPVGAVMNHKWTPKSEGTTTLSGPPPGPYCRDLTDAPPAPPPPGADAGGKAAPPGGAGPGGKAPPAAPPASATPDKK